MNRLSSWIAIGIAAAVVTIVVAVSVVNWGGLDNTGISLNGWVALFLGVLLTLGVGVGLMSLVFISNRRGYDDPPGRNRQN